MINIPEIKLAIVATLSDALEGECDVFYGRPSDYAGGAYVTTARVEATVGLDGITPQSRLERYVADWELVLEIGSGHHHGSPQDADAVAWGITQSVMEALVATPRLSLGDGFMAIRPTRLTEIQSWRESADLETIVNLRVEFLVRGRGR